MHEVLNFLSDLRMNNNREWFADNRERYEQSREKMLSLTSLMINEINRFDPELGYHEPKDCLYRIFRDIRFSPDKTPYKTHMGSYMAKGGKKSVGAGYYLHIEPGASFIGGGCYCPPPEVLKACRTEIFDYPDEYKAIINKKSFRHTFIQMDSDKLKTPPKGFPKDFPDIELLKYKSYVFGANISDNDVLSDNFAERAVSIMRELSPVNVFLNVAIDKWL